MEKIGWIGLGRMGEPMARRLIDAGHPLAVWNRSRDKMAVLIHHGALECAHPAHVAASSDIVFTMVSDTADVEAVLFGENGVASGARPRTIVVDMSTISPIATRRFAARLAEHGVDMLDAPVSGGVGGAADGTLSIMVGGNVDVIERARPVLDRLGSRITRIGDHGAGQAAKMCNQLVVGLTVQAVAEAIKLAEVLGVDPVKVREALLGGFAASRVLEVHGQRMLDQNFRPGFTARLHRKDLRIVLDVAREIGLRLPGAALVEAQLARLIRNQRGDLDSSALLTGVESSPATSLPALPPDA